MVDLPEPEKPGEEHGEALLAARWRGAAQLFHHLGEGEPVGDLQPLAQAAAQFGARNVEDRHLVLVEDLVGGFVLGAFLHVDHVLEVDHLDADLFLVLPEQVLRVVGAVEILARAVLAGARVVAADDEMRAAMIGADQPVPDRLARAGHAHREVQQGHGGGRLRVLVQHRLVAAHAGEVIHVAGLGHADDGWISRLACASRAARKVSSWCARCSGLRVWKATTLRQPSLRK